MKFHLFMWTIVGVVCLISHANAQLVYYYEPDTGNVSFDTSQTRNGKVATYYLELHSPGFRFRNENFIRLSDSTLYTNHETMVGESTFTAGGWEGLYTIGAVLPPGIDEATWTSMFDFHGSFGRPPDTGILGRNGYADVLGGGTAPAASFVYGAPEGEFSNRWDILDPDELVWADQATLIYHEADGQVLVDTTGPDSGYIASLQLSSDGAFLSEHFTLPIDTYVSLAKSDSVVVMANAIEPGQYSLGSILNAGLSQDEFEATFTSAKFVSRAGFKGAAFDFEADGMPMRMAYHAIPEPNGLCLISLAIVSCAPFRPKT